MNKRVFLGGTCNESDWRDCLIRILHIDYFNPVVDDWTPDCMAEELRQRGSCNFCLYTITPRMTGVYSIAEVVDDSNKRPEQTLFCVLETDGELAFTDGQLRSLRAVAAMVQRNGGRAFEALADCAAFLNGDCSIDG